MQTSCKQVSIWLSENYNIDLISSILPAFSIVISKSIKPFKKAITDRARLKWSSLLHEINRLQISLTEWEMEQSSLSDAEKLLLSGQCDPDI